MTVLLVAEVGRCPCGHPVDDDFLTWLRGEIADALTCDEDSHIEITCPCCGRVHEVDL